MPTISAGSVATVYCPVASSITITPGTSGRVSIQGRSRDGGQAVAPQEIYTATTITGEAGDVLTLEAINVAATYTAPAGLDTSLQSLVSGAENQHLPAQPVFPEVSGTRAALQWGSTAGLLVTDFTGTKFTRDSGGAALVIADVTGYDASGNRPEPIKGVTDATGYAIAATAITLTAAGVGSIPAGWSVVFVGDTNQYVVGTTHAGIEAGGTLTLAAPGLRKAITAAKTAFVAYPPVVSRTGQATMLQVTPATDAATHLTMALGAVNVALANSETGNAEFGCWVHIANQNGAGVGEAVPGGTIQFELTTAPASVAHLAQVSFNSNYLREGWNFLKFVTNGAVYNSVNNLKASGSAYTGAHPFGIACAIFGTGANSEIYANNIRSIAINLVTMGGWTLTFDSVWTRFDGIATVIPMADQATDDSVVNALPVFNEYGWKAGFMNPRGVLANPTTDTYAALDAAGIYNDITSYSGFGPPAVEMYAAGWDCLNHSMTHRSAGYLANPGEIKLEVTRARAWAHRSGMYRGTEFYVSPNSSTSRLSEKAVEDTGMLWQRHGKPLSNMVTQWGFDNTRYIGGYDMGHQTTAQSVSLMTNIVDQIIRYKSVFMPFWHFIRTTGDPGDGTGIYTVDNLNIYASNWRQFWAYVRTKELAGQIRVLSPTQYWYGEE